MPEWSIETRTRSENSRQGERDVQFDAAKRSPVVVRVVGGRGDDAGRARAGAGGPGIARGVDRGSPPAAVVCRGSDTRADTNSSAHGVSVGPEGSRHAGGCATR